jgi:hypothetical protein
MCTIPNRISLVLSPIIKLVHQVGHSSFPHEGLKKCIAKVTVILKHCNQIQKYSQTKLA